MTFMFKCRGNMNNSCQKDLFKIEILNARLKACEVIIILSAVKEGQENMNRIIEVDFEHYVTLKLDSFSRL